MNNKIIQVSFVCLSSLLLLAAWFHSNDAAKAAGAAPTVRYVAAGAQCGSRTPCYAQVRPPSTPPSTAIRRPKAAASIYPGMIAPTLTLTQPATVVLTHSEKMEGGYGIGGLSQLLLMQLMGPGAMMNAACGPETRNLPGNLFSAPICQFSSPFPTSTVSMRIAVLQSQTGTAEFYAGAFAFVAEPQGLKAYLPRMTR